jgi:hypothetical protein
MADKKIPRKAPVISIERSEYRHMFRTLASIKSKTSNLLQVLVAIDCRAGNEFAESMRIIQTAPESPIPKLLAAWQQARNTCAEADITRVDGEHAGKLGLPTLAALFEALGRVQEAKGPISPAEVADLLSTVLQVARGEATARLQVLEGRPICDGVPGVGIIPRRILEQIGKGGDR